MSAWDVSLNDVRENFIRGSGKGGQKINKTAVRVQLVHKPTGVIVECQETRSQAKNRELAWAELKKKLSELRRKEAFKKKQEMEKERRRKRGRSAKAKKIILRAKRYRSEKKAIRRRPSLEE